MISTGGQFFYILHLLRSRNPRIWTLFCKTKWRWIQLWLIKPHYNCDNRQTDGYFFYRGRVRGVFFLTVWIKRNITIHLKPPVLLSERPFMRSYSPISLLHWALFVWSRLAVYMCAFSFCLSFFLFFLCVYACAPLQPTSRDKGGVSVETHTSVLSEREIKGDGAEGDREEEEETDRPGGGGTKTGRQGGERGFTHQSLVGSQVHRSVRWEHTVCTPVRTSWPPLPVSVAASPSDTPPRSSRWGDGRWRRSSAVQRVQTRIWTWWKNGRQSAVWGGVKFTSNAGILWNSLLHRVCFM